MSDHEDIEVVVNGREWRGSIQVRTSLSDFLRYELELTGTHLGCEHGVCGACTVLLDGEPIRSCLMLAVQADGHAIRTVESLSDGERLSGFQQAMMDEHGLQCGFCTPGILMSVAAAESAGLSEEQVITEVLEGHICRCTGYAGIREAIHRHWATVGEAQVAARVNGHGGPAPRAGGAFSDDSRHGS